MPRRRCFSADLEEPHEVLGLLLDLDVAVADDPESALPSHRVAGEEPAGDITITCSSAMKRAAPVSAKSGRRMKRSTLFGRRISALSTLPSLCAAPLRTSFSAIEEPRFGMNGNGCAGSIASGVSTGKTWCRK